LKRLILVEEIIRSAFTILWPDFVGKSLEFIGSMGLLGVWGVFYVGLAKETSIKHKSILLLCFSQDNLWIGSFRLKKPDKRFPIIVKFWGKKALKNRNKFGPNKIKGKFLNIFS